jgi:hypothetical protein
VLAALSHLSYEAFYFQEIVLIVLATVLRGSGVKEIHWRAILGAMLVNVGCIAFNRLTPGGIQKTFHWDFFHLFVWGYRHLPGAFSDATRNHTVLITASMFVAGLSGSFCLAQLIGAARVRLAFLVTMCGIAVSGFLYAFAGYHLVMQGPLARVSIVLATYYALASGVLAAAAWRPPSWRAWPVIAFWLFAATGLVAFELSARAQVTEWADTWSYELARLLRLPEAITAGEQFPGAHQRIYLAIDQRPVSTVEPATAPWEIIGAIAWASERSTNKRSMMVDRWKGSQTTPQWFAAPKEWFNRWNGRNFEQGPCGGAAAFSASGSELWLWQTSANTLSKVGAPWEYGCH